MTLNSNQSTQKRPWMVTLFAVIVALSALPQGLELSAPILDSSLASAVQLIFIAIICPLVMGIYGVTAWGLWKLKNWSRYSLIAIIVVNFIIQLMSKSTGSMIEDMPLAGSVGIILGFILRAYVVYWFLDNEHYFDGREDSFRAYEEVNVEFADREEVDEQETDKNSQIMRALVFSSLAGVGVIVLGVAVALYMYISRQTTTSLRYEAPTVRAVTPMPSKTPTGPRSFASIKLTFNTLGSDNTGIQYPEEIIADGQGNIYLNGLMDQYTYKFDPQGKNAVKLDIAADCPDQRMLGTEVVYADQYFYVMCREMILQYDLNNFHLNATFDGNVFSPRVIYKDMAIYPDGTLLILADGDSVENKEVVIHLDPKDGSILQRINNPVSNILNRTAMLVMLKPAVDSQGNIYILDGDDGTTYKFDAEGNYLLKFMNEHAETGIIGDILNPRLSHPANLIVIDANDRILTVDSSNLALFDTEGNFLGQISTEFTDVVKDMHISSEDELYLLADDTQDMENIVSKVFKLKLYWH